MTPDPPPEPRPEESARTADPTGEAVTSASARTEPVPNGGAAAGGRAADPPIGGAPVANRPADSAQNAAAHGENRPGVDGDAEEGVADQPAAAKGAEPGFVRRNAMPLSFAGGAAVLLAAGAGCMMYDDHRKAKAAALKTAPQAGHDAAPVVVAGPGGPSPAA